MTYSKHWFFTPENAGGSASIGRSDGSDWIHFDGGPTEARGEVLVQALNLLDLSGKTPDELARSLADAHAEIARLRAALSALELSANTVSRCYTHRPENFAAALQSLEDDAAAAREALNK